MALGWDTAPGCIQHGVSGADGVYKPYEKCADFFTFGPGSTFGTATDGVSTSYWILTIIGILVMIGAFVAWVTTEDRKLKEQAARLLVSGHAGQVTIADRDVPQPGVGGPVT
jgi:lipoprotein signal peptidase